MKHVTRSLVIALGAIAFAGPALAADLDLPIYVDEAPEYKPVEIGNGWYLRGDISYSVKSSGKVTDYRTFAGGAYGSNNFQTGDISSTWGGSVGVGYTFNRWMRADVTIDKFSGKFNGTTATATPCLPGYTIGTTCASTDTARFDAYSLMANGYIDLGTIKNITPYVGAGAGVTAVRWNNLTNNSFCVNGVGACTAADAAISTQHPGLSSYRMTYALMAGASYDISKNLKFDVGYRYKKVAGGDFFGFDAATAAAGATGAQARDKGITTHEVRMGMRYSLW
jgi:opacity protein-like surface antigen